MAITGGAALEIGAGFRSITEFDVTGPGDGQIKFASANTLLAIYNASAATGNVMTNLSGSDSLLKVDGGIGDDTIILGARSAGYSVTTGAGSDTIKFGDQLGNLTLAVDPQGITGSDAPALDAAVIRVTDFDLTHDTIVFTGESFSLSANQQQDVMAASSLLAAVNLAAGYAHAASVTDKLVAFHYGADTYIYNDEDSSGGISIKDGIVKLAGVTADLTAANYQHG